MNKYYEQNMKQWDEKAKIHSSKSSEIYNIEEFLKGKSSLLPIERNTLSDVSNKKILHVQCHIGFDSISLAQLGANVTGVDFSPEAIHQAKKFSNHLQIPVDFIQANIFDLESTRLEKNSFDVIFASYGVICWIDNLQDWVKILAKYLKPGGMFLLIDDHPYVNTIEEENNKYEIQFNYFKNEKPYEFTVDHSYTGEEFTIKEQKAYEWNHSIDEIISSFLKTNLRLTSFFEYDFTFWKRFSFLTRSSSGYYYMDPDIRNKPECKIPLMFSLTAIK
jgi:2-polyprenyl-3-methyl-5-hydroxy-6-metoxy-1,4-benzoquinol methylase